MTRNPWYLGLMLAWLAVVDAVARRQPPVTGRTAQLWSPLRFGLFVVPIAALFNGVMVHVGATVLVRLPQSWPLFGGPVTLEAFVYGALNGLALTAIFAAFTVVNRMLPVREMIQLIPRAYYPVAVVAAIALTFVPATLGQLRQIREAQAVRGHRLAGVRVVAAAVAAAADRRDGAGAATGRGDDRARVCRGRRYAGSVDAGGGAGGVAAGAGRAAAADGLGAGTLGLVLTVAGAGWWSRAIVVAGRRHPHTRYRPAAWQVHDWLVAGSALVAAALWCCRWRCRDRRRWPFRPYPRLLLPGFGPLMGMATWALLAPVWCGWLRPALMSAVIPSACDESLWKGHDDL